MTIFLFILGCALTENLLFGELCGAALCVPTGSVKNTVKLCLATMFVATFSTMITMMAENWALIPAGAGYLWLLVLALSAIALSALVRIESKCEAMKCLWLPVMIGSVMIGIAAHAGNDTIFAAFTAFAHVPVLENTIAALMISIGYLVVMVMTTGVRERLAYSKIPKCMKGLPISMVVAGLMALVFMGFTGLAV